MIRNVEITHAEVQRCHLNNPERRINKEFVTTYLSLSANMKHFNWCYSADVKWRHIKQCSECVGNGLKVIKQLQNLYKENMEHVWKCEDAGSNERTLHLLRITGVTEHNSEIHQYVLSEYFMKAFLCSGYSWYLKI